MKKLFISCLTAVLSIGLFAVSTVNAASDVSQLFKEFMDECFSDETNVTVFMGNQDMTKEFFDRYRDMYSNNELLIISNEAQPNQKLLNHMKLKLLKEIKKNGQLFFTASLHIILALEI